MKKVNWEIKPQTQPTSTACSHTALSILLALYKDYLTPQEIEKSVPQSANERGEKLGTINQQLAKWCIDRGYRVNMHTFDCQIIDQSWSKLSREQLINRLKKRKNGWVVPGMGKEWTKEYSQSYIDYLEAGGKLKIQYAVTSKLLYKLLENGPILACVSFSTIYGAMRTRIDGDNKAPDDDIDGRALNHSVIIYGTDEQGNFKIADPSWSKKPGLELIEPEVMLAGISTAQIECDNLIFQITPNL